MTAVSVVIPTYNRSGLVQEALASVFAQTFSDYELIVINNGSVDDTSQVLRPLADAGRIRLIEQEPNIGMAGARNLGIRSARGEYVALLDDDDLWPSDKLQWQTQVLRDDPDAVLVHGTFASMLPDGRMAPDDKTDFPSGDVYEQYRLRNWIHSPGQTLIRRDALQAVGAFDRSIWGADDWDLYIRLAKRGPFRWQPRISLHYRVHAENNYRFAVRHAFNDLKVARRHLGWNAPLLLRHFRLAGDYFVPNLLGASASAVEQKQWGRAGGALAVAVAYKPTILVNPQIYSRAWRRFRGKRGGLGDEADA